VRAQAKSTQEFTVADAQKFMEIDSTQANVWTTMGELDEARAKEAQFYFAKVVAAKGRYYLAIAKKCALENEKRKKTYDQVGEPFPPLRPRRPCMPTTAPMYADHCAHVCRPLRPCMLPLVLVAANGFCLFFLL
jgi:hypothetical protein